MTDVALSKLPEKRVVVFGDETAPNAEQRLNSAWHIKFIAITIGLPAALALAYVGVMNASVAAGLATTIPWKIGIGLLAGVLTLSLGALPIAIGLLRGDKEMGAAAGAGLVLLVVILAFSIFSTGSHAYYAMHSKRAGVTTADPEPLLDFDPFSQKHWNFQNDSNGKRYRFNTKGLLRRTNGCRDLSREPFEYQFQKEICRDWLKAEHVERMRRAIAPSEADAGEIESLFSPQAINGARWFLAVWGPAAALLFALLGFAVAGGAISKMLLISNPAPPAMPALTEPLADQPVYDSQSIFDDYCEDCVGKDENAPLLKPPIILESYDKWFKDNGYPEYARLSEAKLWGKFKERYGKYFKHKGPQGGSVYVGLILKNMPPHTPS